MSKSLDWTDCVHGTIARLGPDYGGEGRADLEFNI